MRMRNLQEQSDCSLKSRVLFHPQYSAKSYIVVYSRGGVIFAEGLHFSALNRTLGTDKKDKDGESLCRHLAVSGPALPYPAVHDH